MQCSCHKDSITRPRLYQCILGSQTGRFVDVFTKPSTLALNIYYSFRCKFKRRWLNELPWACWISWLLITIIQQHWSRKWIQDRLKDWIFQHATVDVIILGLWQDTHVAFDVNISIIVTHFGLEGSDLAKIIAQNYFCFDFDGCDQTTPREHPTWIKHGIYHSAKFHNKNLNTKSSTNGGC